MGCTWYFNHRILVCKISGIVVHRPVCICCIMLSTCFGTFAMFWDNLDVRMQEKNMFHFWCMFYYTNNFNIDMRRNKISDVGPMQEDYLRRVWCCSNYSFIVHCTVSPLNKTDFFQIPSQPEFVFWSYWIVTQVITESYCCIIDPENIYDCIII